MSETVAETSELFEGRKKDHIRLSLDASMQAIGGTRLDEIELQHEALPEIDFSEIDITATLFGKAVAVPFFVSSMTAGHQASPDLNLKIARVAEARGWPCAVGSQRRQLTDPSADREWERLRQNCPRVRFFGNIGLAQVIESPPEAIQRLADTLGAEAMFVHTNPLQEALQPEGTPRFRGGLTALSRLVQKLKIPVILKETGCGFSRKTLRRLNGIGLAAIDVSGYGGTHWGRIEGGRAPAGGVHQAAAVTFARWGISTVDSLLEAMAMERDFSVWASGGIRSGLDAAKILAMGAEHVGLAQPILVSALQGEEALNLRMEIFEYELQTAMFCTGSRTLQDLKRGESWRWRKTASSHQDR